MIRSWDVRKAFFNADLNEVIYVHPVTNLCKAGHCWWLRKALCGTRMASQMWGESSDGFRWMALFAVGAECVLLAAYGHHEDDSSSVSYGDDFLAEGSERTLSELDRLLNEHLEVTAGDMIGPGRPGQTRYLKRIIGYTEDLPEHGGPGFFLDGRPQACRLLGAVDEEARWKTSSNARNQGNWHGSERLTGTSVAESGS